eukprot:CAMPEP_0202695780 /NCGR_PEP_ID=MMETSP1385-20130828/9278_1 /ASSEMBLY_ACC=CAM_ASM_000861 /TAXON_ID=933848 /ORGANISM="Elphidium margaritaceum" /LENGTH=323 /DNA_ID=CAMNT_0049351857 /DNA_START=87 /DNA_END=1055 /DNA_ORIENTATION=-
MEKERVINFARELDKAIHKIDAKKVLSILHALSDIEQMSIALLKETELGKKINNIRKMESFKHEGNIREMAQSLVAKWKAQVDKEKLHCKKKLSGKKKLKLKNGAASHRKPQQSQTVSSNGNCAAASATHNGSAAAPSVAIADTAAAVKSTFKRAPCHWQTGDDCRDRMVTKFIAVLKPAEDHAEFVHFERVAADIEQQLCDSYGASTEAYRNKYRELHFNIKKNVELKRSLLAGHVKPLRLVTMSYEEMASKELKFQRDEDRKWSMEEARNDHGLDESKAMTDEFKCGKCGKRKCKYSQAQTRSADEPMTTFVTCLTCGNRW